MESYRFEYPVTMMCRLLSVSRSGFYAWLKRPVSAREQQRIRVSTATEAMFIGFKKRYGAPRLTLELNAQGIDCCVNHVAQLLQEKGLRARNGKGFRYRARVESKTHVSDNLLARRFKVEQPNLKWVSDITYIKVSRTWLYLAVVMDLFSRKIIGWALDNHMREGLILSALNMATSCRDGTRNVLLHSDRGVQYRGHEYQDALKEKGIQCSMSRKGNCWDNAVMESFFGRFKVELIYAENYKSIETAKAGIFEYIEIFYNRQRRHSAIDYMSPNDYEQQYC
ncbi:MAG: IS3 family transposase [Gammaproteobacteria bacterium]